MDTKDLMAIVEFYDVEAAPQGICGVNCKDNK